MVFPDFNKDKINGNPFDPPGIDWGSIPAPSVGSIPDFDVSFSNLISKKNQMVDAEGNVKNPTITDSLREYADKRKDRFNELEELYRFSEAESARYKDPNIIYDPRVNMEDIYAKAHPTTYADQFGKAWDITFSGNTYSNAYAGFKELAKGNTKGFSDNQYNKDVVDAIEGIENASPYYLTMEEQVNGGSFLKQLIPSIGYLGQAVKDIAIGHLAVTAGGAVIGGGVASIPAAIGANILQLGKDVVSVGGALKNIWTVSKALAQGKTALNAVNLARGAANAASNLKNMATIANLGKAAKFGTSTFLFANGEAAMQAEMNAREFEKKELEDYFKRNGRYASGEDLEKIKKGRENVLQDTYLTNLPLIMASDALQFGNLLRGKIAPKIADELAVSIKDGVASTTNAYLKVGGRYVRNAAAEGAQEFLQGAADDWVKDYYDDDKRGVGKYLAGALKSIYERGTSKEGLLEFAGGALIGAASNVGDFYGIRGLEQKSKQYADEYNQTFNTLFKSTDLATKRNAELKNAILSKEYDKIDDISRKTVIDAVNTSARLGKTEILQDKVSQLKNLNETEFSKLIGFNADKNTKDEIISSLERNIKSVSEVRNNIESAFGVNPFIADNAILERLGKSPIKDKNLAERAWADMKDIVTSMVAYKGNIDEDIDAMTAGVLSVEAESMTDGGIAKVVENWVTKTKAKVGAGVATPQEESTLRDVMTKTNEKDAYNTILDNLFTVQEAQVIRGVNKLKVTRDFIDVKVNRVGTAAGRREMMLDIIKNIEQIYEDRTKKTETPANGQTVTNTGQQNTTEQQQITENQNEIEEDDNVDNTDDEVDENNIENEIDNQEDNIENEDEQTDEIDDRPIVQYDENINDTTNENNDVSLPEEVTLDEDVRSEIEKGLKEVNETIYSEDVKDLTPAQIKLLNFVRINDPKLELSLDQIKMLSKFIKVVC